MPFKSKAQARKFYSLVEEGKIKESTAKEWAKATPNIAALPEKIKQKPRKSRVIK